MAMDQRRNDLVEKFNIEMKYIYIYIYINIRIVDFAFPTFDKVRFFFLGVDKLFDVGDKVVRVERSNIESKTLVWRLERNFEGEWLWNFKHEKKMHYEL